MIEQAGLIGPVAIYQALHYLGAHAPKEIDAVVCFNGLGESERYLTAISITNEHPNAMLLMAGRGRHESENPYLESYQGLVALGLNEEICTVCQGPTDHTGTQATWAIEQVLMCKLKTCLLVVTQEHMERAWRTVVKVLIKNHCERGIKIYPHFVLLSPFRMIPEVCQEALLDGWTLSKEETKKISRYIEDVASDDEVLMYLQWMLEDGKK